MLIFLKNVKNIIILVLIIFLGCLIYFNINYSGYEYKERINQLERSNDSLHKQRDSIDYESTKLRQKYDSLLVNDSIISEKIDSVSNLVIIFKNNANRSKTELDKLRENISTINSQIDSLRNNVAIKTDDDLLESLKNNLNK